MLLTKEYVASPSGIDLLLPEHIESGEEIVAEDYLSLAFDPGGTTGWSLFAVNRAAMRSETYGILNNISFWSAGQFAGPEGSQAQRMAALAHHWRVSSIVIEDFILRKFTMARELLAPVRVTARFQMAFELLDNPSPHGIVFQPASLAMTAVTDERQKEWGFWLPGQPHANDATKHNITWLRRKKAIIKKQVAA